MAYRHIPHKKLEVNDAVTIGKKGKTLYIVSHVGQTSDFVGLLNPLNGATKVRRRADVQRVYNAPILTHL